jgi:hypothetical protein
MNSKLKSQANRPMSATQKNINALRLRNLSLLNENAQNVPVAKNLRAAVGSLP